MTNPAGVLAAIALTLGAVACATPLSHRDVETRLRGAGASVRGLGPDFVVAPIHADSRIAAWTLIAEARAEGASQIGERLSHDLRQGASRRRGVVVGGPYADLTRLALLDALDLLEGRSLAGLTLVYVGDGRHARELRQAARARRARFYHRDFP